MKIGYTDFEMFSWERFAMLKRKISDVIEQHLKSNSERILLIDGARQVGKTYIIRYVGKKLFANFIEINMLEDSVGNKLFANATTVDDFYLRISVIAGDKMKEKYLDAQSPEVDGISGATITSSALNSAMADVFSQAEAPVEAAEKNSPSVESVTQKETEASVITAGENEENSKAVEVEAASTDTDALTGQFKKGTYTATATGMDGDVTVKMTFSEDGITKIEIDVSGETPGIGAEQGPTLEEQLMTAQSADIDGVSGATVTSNAVKTAAQDCIDQASGQ